MKKLYRYNTIFMHGSLQSVGHTMDYFIEHTKKLVIYIIMPRVQGTQNLLRVYDRGMLVEEKNVSSSSKLFQYYFLWWFHQQQFIFYYFARNDDVLVLTSHPVAFFGMSIIKLFRHVQYAYWIGDYFPPVHWSLIAFEKLKKYYHDRVSFTYYLSDTINAIFNGRVVQKKNKQTVMWGVQPYQGIKRQITIPFRLLFVGVIRQSQGIEDLLLFIKNSSYLHLSILGVCEITLYKKYQFLLEKYRISDRVSFPNTFISDNELRKLARHHHVGIALYDKGTRSATYYTDPGKVKTYIELGLPVIMSNTSAIAEYVNKYKAGIVIDALSELPDAIKDLRDTYQQYLNGVQSFSNYFEYERYYKKAFNSLENL